MNNSSDRPKAVFLLVGFPLIASIWELLDPIVEIYRGLEIHGTIIHIPGMGMFNLVLAIALTFGQYALASKIAGKRYSKHVINTVLELALLAYTVFI